MSLLEDVFLEDEANEAQELERIIEGDEYDEERADRQENSDENSEKEDEAEEDKRRVDPSSSTKVKRVTKNPRFVLNPARLTGPRGIQVIPDHFKDFKFKGKGHEKEDLDLVLKKLEHWAYRLYPKFQFEDCLKKIETLGKKRPVMVHLHKIRSGQLLSEETVVQKDSSDDEAPVQQEEEEDEFDKLLNQQIQLAKAATPIADKRSSIMMPKATSSPSINDEQRERMMKNRKLAEERRLARLKAQNISQNNSNLVDLTGNQNFTKNGVERDSVVTVDITRENANDKAKMNVIDSSDDDETAITIVDKVIVDVQKTAGEAIDISEAYQKKSDRNEVDLDDQFAKTNHNRSNVIDSSDDDDDMTINNEGLRIVDKVSFDVNKPVDEVIDISEGYQTKRKSDEVVDLDDQFAKIKHSRSNIIDSSDDDGLKRLNDDKGKTIVNKPVDEVIDISEGYQKKRKSDEVVDVDDRFDKINHNRSNVIDSSDDESDMTINNEGKTIVDKVTVDVHKTVEKVIDITAGYQKKSNSDEVVDLDNQFAKTKRNRTNVIDTSDDDADITINDDEGKTIVDKVTVDVHKTVDGVIDISEGYRKKSKSDEVVNLDNQFAKTKHNRANVIDSSDDDADITINDDEGKTMVDKVTVDVHKTVDEVIDISEGYLKKSNSDEVVDLDDLDKKENKDSNLTNPEVLDDLMDVDFTDDF